LSDVDQLREIVDMVRKVADLVDNLRDAILESTPVTKLLAVVAGYMHLYGVDPAPVLDRSSHPAATRATWENFKGAVLAGPFATVLPDSSALDFARRDSILAQLSGSFHGMFKLLWEKASATLEQLERVRPISPTSDIRSREATRAAITRMIDSLEKLKVAEGVVVTLEAWGAMLTK